MWMHSNGRECNLIFEDVRGFRGQGVRIGDVVGLRGLPSGLQLVIGRKGEGGFSGEEAVFC